jgi:GAF domain-containing protein
MPAAFLPTDEAARLQILRSLNLLGTTPEVEFDNIVQLGKALFDVPICLISLVDEHYQWFKAGVGLDTRQTPRSISFCSHAILSKTVLVVPDATRDERFADNPLVTAAPFIRFYAGAPVSLTSGHAIGTLCVISPLVRPDFGSGEIHKLEMLAGTVTTAIAARVLRGRLHAMRAQTDSERLGHAVPFAVAVLDEKGRIKEWNGAFARLCQTLDVENCEINAVLGNVEGWHPDLARQASANGHTLRIRCNGGVLTVYPRGTGFLIVGD